MASTARVSWSRSSSAPGSTVGSCLHRLPPDPHKGSHHVPHAINNPFTSHCRNPQILEHPVRVLDPTSPATRHSPALPNRHPCCHRAREAIVPSLCPQGMGFTLGGFCLHGEQLGAPASPLHRSDPPHPPLALAKPLPWAWGSSRCRHHHHGGVGHSSSVCAAAGEAEKEVFVCR